MVDFFCLFVFNGRLFDGTLLNTFCCRHCYLIAKSYLTPCGSMDSSMPGSSVLHYPQSFLTFVSIAFAMLPKTISPSATLFSVCLQSFPASGSFPVSHLLSSGGQSIGASASATVHPVVILQMEKLGPREVTELGPELRGFFCRTHCVIHQCLHLRHIMVRG